MKKLLFLLSISIFLSCYTGQGVKLTNVESITTSKFDLKFEPKEKYDFLKGFFIDKIDEDGNISISINKNDHANRFEFLFSINALNENIPDSISDDKIAEEFKNRELQSMINYGVKKGLYEIDKIMNYKKVKLSNKIFYKFSYRTFTDAKINYCNLYYYIDRKNKCIPILLHSEMYNILGYSKDEPIYIYEKYIPKLLDAMKIKSKID